MLETFYEAWKEEWGNVNTSASAYKCDNSAHTHLVSSVEIHLNISKVFSSSEIQAAWI